MRIDPAISFGETLTDERTRLLGSVPIETDTGSFLRALVVAADPQLPDPGNIWSLLVGEWALGGAFRLLHRKQFTEGFPEGPQRIDLDPEIGVRRGAVLALRISPSGSTATPLTGLSVIPEYAFSGGRTR